MLLKNIQILLVSALVVVVFAGCQKAKDIEPEPVSIELVKPKNNAVLSVISDEQQVSIALKGGVDSSNVTVLLNGADITSSLYVSALYMSAPFDAIEPHLQSGENDLVVTEPRAGINKAFTFFIDVQAPTLHITEINDGSPVQPVPGGPDEVKIEGVINDPSQVRNGDLIFSVGGQRIASEKITIDQSTNPQTFTAFIPYPDRSAFYPSGSSQAFNPNKHWVTTSPDITYTVKDVLGHQSSGQWVVPQSRFKGAAEMFISHFAFNPIGKFLNSITKGIPSKLKGISGNTGDPNFNIPADPLGRSWPSGDERSPDFVATADNSGQLDFSNCPAPAGSLKRDCPFSLNGLPASVVGSIPDGVKKYLVPVDALGGPAYCSAAVFDNSVQACAIYITNVEFSQPTYKFEWNKKSETPLLDVIIGFGNVKASAQIVGLSTTNASLRNALVNGQSFIYNYGKYDYEGRLKTNIKFDDLKLITKFNVSAGAVNQSDSSVTPNAKLLTFNRVPGIESSMGDLWLNLIDKERPLIYGSECDICDISFDGPFGTKIEPSIKDIEWFYNFNLIKTDGVSVGVMIMSEIEKGLEKAVGPAVNEGVAAMEKALNDFAFSDQFFPPTADPNDPDTSSVQFDVSATSAETVKAPLYLGGYGQGGRFVFDGKVKTNSYDVNKPALVGFDFTKQHGFDDWMFYDKLFPSKTPNDFSVALSANILNQYLAAAYQTGLYDLVTLSFDGDKFAGDSDLQNKATSQRYTLQAELNQSPSIKLVPFQKEINYGGCVEFQGMGNCKSGGFHKVVQQEIPEHVSIHIPNAVITVAEDTNINNIVFRVTADIKLKALVKSQEFMPLVLENGQSQFADVRIIDVEIFDADNPVAAEYEKAHAAASLQVLLNKLGLETGNLLKLPRRVVKLDQLVDLSKLGSALDALDLEKEVLPFEIGIDLSVLKVDRGGDYLTSAGNFIYKKLPGDTCPDAAENSNYLFSICVEGELE